ncbi:MAG: Flp family type IVb pilin [Firmicutes bacterium]|nr:Flp family type IVb pilin [Bacillota bacterium]
MLSMLSMVRFYLQTRLFKDEKGQGMVEYGLIIALVAVGAIVALTGLRGGLTDILGRVSTELTNAN